MTDLIDQFRRLRPRRFVARRGAPRRRQAFLLVVVGLLAASAYFAVQYASARRPGPPFDGPHIAIRDELAIKVELAEKLRSAPDVIVLGGSRGLRFEPSYLEKKTGLSAFNAAVRNSSSEEVWGLINFLHRRFPDARPRYLWLIHVKVLRGWWRVSPTLITDSRLNRYFPEAFLREQDQYVPHSPEDLPKPPKLPPPKWAADGHILWSHSDTIKYISQGLRCTTNQWFRKNGPGSPTIEARPRAYFEKTLMRMNELGARPVLVLMPVHPTVLAKIGPAGFWQSQRALLDYLKPLKTSYRFTLVDFTNVASFDGDPDQFYDGYHPKTENTRRIVDEVLRRHPDAFD
jgi:hypothetical protein